MAIEQIYSISASVIYDALREELAEIQDLDKLSQFLGMDLVFSEEATHPHVVWQPIEWTKITA